MMHNLADIRTDLTGRLAQLAARVERIESDQRTPLDDDADEQALEREVRGAQGAEEDAALAEMKAIRAALARLDAGLYGLCTSCGVPIDAARLAALPAAAHCIACERELAA